MSNVIPYFVLAVVALGFFAICYAVFSRGDGESQAKPKTQRNSHVDNNVEAKHDSPTTTESKHGDVTITHTGGTNVYTASIADSTEGQSGKVLHDGPVEVLHDKPSEVLHNDSTEALVDSTDTSFNRRDGKNTHVENTSTGYSLALGGHNDAVTSAESNTGENSKSQATRTEPAADDTKGELLHDESTVVENENVVTPSVSDETIVMTAVSDIKHSNGNQATLLMDKTRQGN